MPLYWSVVEPERGRFDFSAADRLIGQAADRGVRVLPFIYGSPAWAEPRASRPPLVGVAARAWHAFLARLVDRYGPHGSFWTGRARRLPVRRWQIWNEPNFPLFWSGGRPSPAAYVRLLRGSARVIRRHDRGAIIVAAGLAPVEDGMYPWTFLREMYRVPGARASFDIAALHPYSTSVGMLEYELRLTRRAMARAGDGRKPLLVSEFGVASDGSRPNPFDKGPRGQARFLAAAYRLVIANRLRWRLAGAYWFTWRDGSGDDPNCIFCRYAGLFEADGSPKPAWWSFRRIATRSERPVH